MQKNKEKIKFNFGLILAVYLLGIFMGALDTGIVTPGRTVIQESLGVSDKAGIWMITIYTLAYASSIPVMGKLADRMGRRTIYLISIFLFGAGSLMCGLSHTFGSFPVLLVSRVIQAIGGGGIMPVATAEFGTTFPEEKRGMALGMVGGVFGIANIFGASAGSAIMDLFGTDRWEFIFYVNVPIAAAIIATGFFVLPNTKEKSVSKIDALGICIIVIMVLCLMYGIKNIDFFDFLGTLTSRSVYPFLIAFALLLPFFILTEKRAEDPVMNLSYFTNIHILVTMSVAIITGIVLMGVIFIPQLCENAMMIPTGKGGYFVIALGIFAGVGAPLSGRLTDRFGPKFVLGLGFTAAIIGSLITIFATTRQPGAWNVFLSLMFIGLGIGFTTGAPLNYMMLWEVDERESNSALATLSLVRSIGTVIAPAIMVGFIAHAGAGISDDIMKIMPDTVNVPQLPYAAELTEEMKEQNIKGVPDLQSMTEVHIDMTSSTRSEGKNNTSEKDGGFEIPSRLMDELKASDVTTITASVKDLSSYMFEEKTPEIEDDIYQGIDKGIAGIDDGIARMTDNINKMTEARNGMQEGIDGMAKAISKQNKALAKMKRGRTKINSGIRGINKGIDALKKQKEETPVPEAQEQMQAQIDKMKSQRDEMVTARSKMDKGISGLRSAVSKVTAKRNKLISQQAEMDRAIAGIREGRQEASDTVRKMEEMKAAVPAAFEQAREDYLKQIDDRSEKIQKTYQDALNVGFRQIYLMVGIASLVGILLLILYRRKPDRKFDDQ